MEKTYRVQVFLIDSTDQTEMTEVARRVFELDEVEGEIHEWAEEEIQNTWD